MRKIALCFIATSICFLSAPAPIVHAADMTVTKTRPAKVKAQRMKVFRDPCRRWRAYAHLDSFAYEHRNLVYVPGDSYRASYCIDGDTGPIFHPGWSWGW
jgi:hypothetical protein